MGAHDIHEDEPARARPLRDLAEAAPLGRPRNPLWAVILTGLGPGAGHAHVGHPLRGVILAGLLLASTVAWILVVHVSYDVARLAALPMMILLLVMLVDAGRLARRAPRPFPLGRWQSPWILAGFVAATGVLIPMLLATLLSHRVSLVQVPDDSMDPALVEGDWLLARKRASLEGLERGDIVVVRREARASAVRRLMGLPGERVIVRRGLADIDGVSLPLRLARPLLAQDLTLPHTRLARNEMLVLGDRRRPEEANEARVPMAALAGKACWILLPVDLDPLRIGARP